MHVLSTLLIAVLLLVALNAAAYGVGFIFDPATGAGEFGHDTAQPAPKAMRLLVGFVGVGFIGFASFAVLAAVWVRRGNPAGLTVALVLGASYGLLAGFAASKKIWMDAGIYGAFAATTMLLATALCGRFYEEAASS